MRKWLKRDTSPYSVFSRNLNFVLPDVNVAVKNRADHRVRALDGFFPASCGFYIEVRPFFIFDTFHTFGDSCQMVLVTVHQADLCIIEGCICRQIIYDPGRKLDAARADKRDFLPSFLLPQLCT